MKTILYDINKKEKVFETENGYLIDGKPAQLPQNLVELKLIDTPPPIVQESQVLEGGEFEADIEKAEYKRVWTVRNKTQYEIDMEGWLHIEYQKRMIVNKSVADSDLGQKHFIRLSSIGHPVLFDEQTEKYTIYINEIDQRYKEDFDSLEASGMLILEDKPQK